MLHKQAYAIRLLIDKFNMRERVLMISVGVGFILLLFQGLIILTGLDKHTSVLMQIDQYQQESTQIEVTLNGLKAAINNPNVIALQNSNNDLKKRIDTLSDRIGSLSDALMTPERMVGLLKDLLAAQPNLTLLSFEVLPTTEIKSNNDGETLFFEHGLVLELEGQYEALVSYLEAIEASPSQLFWNRLFVESTNFPMLKIQLRVHTLSQVEEWLNV